MQKFIILFIAFLLSAQSITISGGGEYTPDQLDNKVFQVKDGDTCQQNNPDGCCFEGDVTLKIERNGQQIKSLTFSGNQIGANCEDSLKVIPSQQSEGQESIKIGNFFVTDENKKSEPYSIFSKHDESVINGVHSAISEFKIKIPQQNGVIDQTLQYTSDPSENSYSPSKQLMGLFSFVCVFTFML